MSSENDSFIRAKVTPLETVHYPEGNVTKFAVDAENEGDVQIVGKTLAQVSGGRLLSDAEVKQKGLDITSRTSFGFDSKKWNAKWEPKGPSKKPWKQDSSNN